MAIDPSPDRVLSRRLSKSSVPANGQPTSKKMAPALSYGRHRGPSRPHSRLAAVAVALYQDQQDGWTIPLTLRPTSLQHHGGQVCLPGGRVESGEQLLDAAIREFEEELGVRAELVSHYGGLSPQYVYASDNLVRPEVFMIRRPEQPWRPDPAEVAEVIPMPLSVLLDPRRRVAVTQSKAVRRGNSEVGELRFRSPVVRFGGHDIWGATALILEELADLFTHEDWQA